MSEKPHPFESRLFYPRNIEGRPNTKPLEAVRHIEEFLRTNYFTANKKLVGLAPYGSTMKGYNFSESDLDIIILYDAPRDTIDARREFTTLSRETSLELQRRGLPANVALQAQNLNRDFTFPLNPDSEDYGWFVGAIANMSRLVTGSVIRSYREWYKNEFRKLPATLQNEILEDALLTILESETPESLRKFLERQGTRDPSEEQIETLAAKRKVLWERRLRNLWHF